MTEANTPRKISYSFNGHKDIMSVMHNIMHEFISHDCESTKNNINKISTFYYVVILDPPLCLNPWHKDHEFQNVGGRRR